MKGIIEFYNTQSDFVNMIHVKYEAALNEDILAVEIYDEARKASIKKNDFWHKRLGHYKLDFVEVSIPFLDCIKNEDISHA